MKSIELTEEQLEAIREVAKECRLCGDPIAWSGGFAYDEFAVYMQPQVHGMNERCGEADVYVYCGACARAINGGLRGAKTRRKNQLAKAKS